MNHGTDIFGPALPTPTPDELLDELANRTLDEERSCRKCAYNIVGLPRDGHCPECGAAVRVSARGDFLRFCDPAWLLKLGRGVGLILANVAVAVVGAVVLITLELAEVRHSAVVEAVVEALVFASADVLFVVGVWLLTTRDPGASSRADFAALSRAASAAGLVAVALQWLLAARPTGNAPLDVILDFALGAVAAVAPVTILLCLNGLAVRIPDARLAARARLLAWAFGIGYGVFLSFNLVANLLSITTVRGPTEEFAAVATGTAFVVLGFGVLYVVTLVRFRRRLREAADKARATWARAPRAVR